MKVDGKKVCTLAYADDIVLIAEDKEGMKEIIRKLETYLEEKGLELNVEKTKVMRFIRGGGRKKKVRWKWKGRYLEEEKTFKYLEYVLQSNGGQEETEHIKDRVKKGAAVMGSMWGLEKRRFTRDWGKRVWLFDVLVWSVVSYGAEIWGWKGREGVE